MQHVRTDTAFAALAAAAFGFAGCASVPTKPARFVFVLDGKAIDASITPVGHDGAPQCGDVAWISGPRIVLDEPGAYELERDRAAARGDRLWAVHGGTRRLVGLEVKEPEDVADLVDSDWHDLRGVEFECWDPAFVSRLAAIDARRCLVTFRHFTHFERLPPLPAHLRYLDLHYSHVDQLADLARLDELRFLVLPHREEVTSVDWATALPCLRHLDLTGTAVHDLTPLGCHPTLHTVLAAHAPITKLPATRMPSLRRFVAHSSGCPDGEAARFRALQPRTAIAMTRGEMLAAAVHAATSLRIRTGCTVDPRPTDRVVYTTDRPDEIAELVGLVRMFEGYCGESSVPGCDRFSCEFLSPTGDRLLLLGYGDIYVRSSLWDDAGLDESCRAPLRRWFEQRGLGEWLPPDNR